MTEQSTKRHYTSIVQGDEVRKRFTLLRAELRNVLQKLHQDKLVLNYGSRVAIAKPVDIVRIVSEWSQRDLLDLNIRNIIVNSILSAENKQIGSGIICAALLASDDAFHEKIETFKKNRTIEAYLHSAIEYCLGAGIINQISRGCLEMGGLSSTLRFRTGTKDQFFVKQTSTEKLPGIVHPLFGKFPHHLEGVQVFAVDGIIESLGSLDHVLRSAAETKQNVVICAEGFNPDIVNTLSHNWQSKKLKVFPVWVQKWSEDNKTCMQVCQELNIECISSEKGQTLNRFNLQDASTIDVIYFDVDYIALQKDGGETIHLDIIVPKRFESLVGVIEDRCRLSLKNLTSIARSGPGDLKFLKSLSNHLNLQSDIKVSGAAQVIGLKTAESCRKIMKTMGTMILSEH